MYLNKSSYAQPGRRQRVSMALARRVIPSSCGPDLRLSSSILHLGYQVRAVQSDISGQSTLRAILGALPDCHSVLTTMAALSHPSTERWVASVWDLWTQNDRTAQIGDAATKNDLRTRFNRDTIITPAERLAYVRLLDRMDEAAEFKTQATDALNITPDYDMLLDMITNSRMGGVMQWKPAMFVTEEAKEAITDHIVRCKSAIRYFEMYKARLQKFKDKLDENNPVGLRTQANFMQVMQQTQAFVDARTEEQNLLQGRLDLYGFVSLRSKPRFVAAEVFIRNWVVLCYGYDDNGRIVDRTMRKEEGHSLAQWDRVWRWKRDDQTTGIPNEYFLGKKCHDEVGYNFVKHARYAIDTAARKITIYTNYCPCGDLSSLHEIWNSEIEQQHIPEPIVWYIFHRLVESCSIMEQGSYRAETAYDDWRQIIHRDIKPENIFLDTPDSTHFPQWPVPKLGDFGMARETTPAEGRNPVEDFAFCGTAPFSPPEQVNLNTVARTGDEANPYKLLSHTNIWAIGLVMLELTSGGAFDQSLQKRYSDGPDEHNITSWAQDNYSWDLTDLIRRCIRYYADERISAENLWNEIGLKMAANGEWSEYVKNASAGIQPKGGPYEWTTARERYKVDMVRDPDMAMDDVDQITDEVSGVAL